MSKLKTKTSPQNNDHVEEKEESIEPIEKISLPVHHNESKKNAAVFYKIRRYNNQFRKLHNLKYLETATKSNTRQEVKQTSKSNLNLLPKYENQFVLSSPDVTQPRNSSDRSLYISKSDTEIPKQVNATEVYVNKTTLKYTQRYLTRHDYDSLASAIKDLEKITHLRRTSKYDSSDCSMSSYNLVISNSTSGSDSFTKESSKNIVRVIKSDNTLKSSFHSNQSSQYIVPNIQTLSNVTLQNSIVNKKIDEIDTVNIDKTRNLNKGNIFTNNVDNKHAIKSSETAGNHDDNPLYPKIDKIVVEIPTSSRDEMKYHAFLTDHMITTEDPLTLMLKNKDDELIKNKENAVLSKAKKSITKIPLPNIEKSGKKCVEELRCFSSLTDLWDKLAIYFDVSLKRMEISLTEKILSEIKRSYDKIEKYASEQTQSKLNSIKSKIEIENKPSSKTTKHDYLSEFIQCNIQNQIDKLPFKINIGDVKMNLEDTFEAKQLKKPLFKQYLETLKPLGVLKKKTEATYEGASRNNEDRGNDHNQSGYRKVLNKSLRFVRANAVVISGVPVFFMTLIVIYGVILWTLKVVKIYKNLKN